MTIEVRVWLMARRLSRLLLRCGSPAVSHRNPAPYREQFDHYKRQREGLDSRLGAIQPKHLEPNAEVIRCPLSMCERVELVSALGVLNLLDAAR